MNPTLQLRRFLYLNEGLTDQYLAQVEGGLFDEESQATKDTRDRHGRGGARLGPVGGSGSRGSAEEESRAKTMRQTPESGFGRLAGVLEEQEQAQWIESLDDEIFDSLRRGEVLEIEAVITIPPILKILVVVGQVPAVEELMEAMGEQFPAEAVQGLATMAAIGELIDSIVVQATAAGSPEFTFLAEVDPTAMRVPIDQLEGEARLYCTLDRKLREGETFTLVDMIPAIRNLPNRDEISFDDEQSAEILGDPIRPPAAIVTPIAIFR